MIYAEFYELCTGYVQGSIPPVFDRTKRKPIPACGDRSVIIIDGRLARYTMHAIAREEAVKRGYIGYKLCKGDNIARGTAFTQYQAI